MGTSTNYKAPTSPQWSNLKRKITRITRRGSLSPSDTQSIVRDFVTVNYGYSQGASRGGGTGQVRAAQDVAQNIGGFLSAVADVGFREAFEQAGLGSLEGKSVSEIGYSLLDCLGGPSSTIDRADARAALRNLMNEILGNAENLEEVEEAMQTISQGESLVDIILKYFGYYIFEQFCSKHYADLINSIGNVRAGESIAAIQKYIFNALRHVTRHQDVRQIDWKGSQGQQIVEKICRDTLEVFSV